MMIRAYSAVPIFVASLTLSAAASAATRLEIVAPSQTAGAAECRSPYGGVQCMARPFDRSRDLACWGNGSAMPAVARDTIAGYAKIHSPEYINDGYYGNGSSWISVGANSWVKIDLGAPVRIDGIRLGRDRTGGYDDRDPGRILVSVAKWDWVYANGDDGSDAEEYATVFDSAQMAYSGVISGKDTLQASFDPVVAQFVKVQVTNAGTAIDEIEVLGTAVELPRVEWGTGSLSWPVPPGMKAPCLGDHQPTEYCVYMPLPCPNNPPESSGDCPFPRLLWNGYRYRAFNYTHNPNAMAILAYDSRGNIAKRWEKQGSLADGYDIVVDPKSETVSFSSQSDLARRIQMSWADLCLGSTCGVDPMSTKVLP